MTKTKEEKIVTSEFRLDDDTKKAMLDISITIKGSGFVPHSKLKEQFGDRYLTTFSAIAYRDYRIVREVRRPWENEATAVGFEWADRRFSRQEIKKIPVDMQWVVELASPGGPRYKDFERVVFGCRWTNSVLAALPVADSDKRRVFERVNGDVLIPAYCQRAMMKKVLPLVGKTMSLADNIRCSAIRVHVNGNMAPRLMPVVDERQHVGRGVTEHESLPPGTEFEMEMWHPTSEISREQLLEAVALAGRIVRLSPAKSSGYGDFEVLAVNGERLAK